MKRPRTDENVHAAATLDEILDRGASRPLAPRNGAAGGPTSYAGLFPGLGAAAAEPAGGAARRLKTFEDVATARQTAAAPARVPLSQADWLPPALGGAYGAAARRGAAAAAAQAALPALPLAADAPPMDWSLRDAARFSSPQPFAVWRDARAAPRREALAAQRAFAAGSGDAALSLPQRLLAATMVWQHPAEAAPPAEAGAGGARRGAPRAAAPSPAARRRWLDWQAALAAAYDALRAGRCDAFYVASPPPPPGGRARPWAALFRASGVGGGRRATAALSRSTPGARGLLDREGVGYAAPLLPRGGAAAAGAGEAGDEGRRSALWFEGALRAHGLFELLLNRARALLDDGADAPAILAPAHFAGAAPRAFVLAGGGGAAAAGGAHHLALRGPALPPWVVDRVLAVLAAAQPGGLALAAEPRPGTAFFNLAPEEARGGAAPAKGGGCAAEEPLDDHEARQRGALGAAEAARWRRAEPGLAGGAAVRELRAGGGVFEATKVTALLAVQAHA